MKLGTRKKINLSLIILTLSLYFLTKLFAPVADKLYLGGLFQILRIVYDHTMGLLPMPFIYIILPIVLFLVFKQLFRRVNWKAKLLNVGQILLYLLCAFYLVWAINYNATPVERKIGLTIENPTDQELLTRFEEVSANLNSLSANIGTRPNLEFNNLEKIIRKELELLLQEFKYPTFGRVRVRKIIPGSILRIRTSGIYIPHAFEGHVDGGLYRMQWPFTLAHEMAHGYGITHESDCNFFAYLVCNRIDDPIFQYSANMAYWRYLAYQVRNINKDFYQKIRNSLDPKVENDLAEIRKHIDRFPDLMPKYRNVIYDKYLKTHGVSSGIKSYDRMILLLEAWNKQQSQ